MSLDYLKEIHEGHEKWLIDDNFKGIPILTINSDHDFENNFNRQQNIMEDINTFLQSLKERRMNNLSF